MPVDAAYYRELLRDHFAGRKVIFAFGHLAVMANSVKLFADLGAARPFALLEGIGAGPGGVTEDDMDWRVIGEGQAASDLMTSIRNFERALANLDDEVRAAVEAYDPDREAIVLRALFSTAQQVAGRPVWAPRRPAWIALEDKVVIDELWDQLGVPRADCRIVPAERAALEAAAREVDRGAGTVWAGDARDGWHGGSVGTHWVVTGDHAAAAADWLRQRCDRARVMPFLEGVPCSIHGIVFPDEVIALRPVEMVTLRDEPTATLRYCGCATSWDPPAADRAEMRALARRVGAALRERVDFRGTFTIDGVMTEDGFRPTELNPRYGAGIAAVGRGLPELPLYYLDLAIVAGEPWDYRPRDLEELLVTAGDSNRVAACHTWDPAARSDSRRVAFARDDAGNLRVCDDDDERAIGAIEAGPSPLGGYYRMSLEPGAVAVGPALAPQLAPLLRLCDRELGTSLGKLTAAREVR